MQCDQVIKELATPTDHRDSTALAGHIAGCPACAGWANRAVQLDRLWEATRPPEPTPEVWDAVWARMAASLDPSTSTELESSIPTRTASLNGSPTVVKLPPKGARHSPRSRSRPWRLAAISLVGLAQAAAILLAVGLAWHQSGSSQTHQIAKPPDLLSSPLNSDSAVHIAFPAEGFPVVVDEGHSIVIQWGRQEDKVVLPIFLANLSILAIHADGQALKVVDHTPEGGVLFGVDDWYVMYNAVESMTSPLVAMKE